MDNTQKFGLSVITSSNPMHFKAFVGPVAEYELFEDTIKKNFPVSRRPYIVAGRRTPVYSGSKGHAEASTLHLETVFLLLHI